MSFRPAGYSDEESDDDGFMCSWSDDDDDNDSHRQQIHQPVPETPEKIFYNAVKSNDTETIKNMIADGFDVNTPLDGGLSAIMAACSNGSSTLVQLLIDLKADVNYSCEMFTPLMALCKCTYESEDEVYQCFNALIQNGADINAYDRHGCTALMFACDSGHLKLVKALVDLNCDINIQDVDGWSALFHAILNGGREDIIRVLISGKARVDLIDRRKRSPLDLVLIKGYEHLEKLVCTKRERRKLENKETLSEPCELPSDPLTNLLQHLPTGKHVLEYSNDVENLLHSMHLGQFRAQFKSVALNDFLLITDEKLKKCGVKFSVHRHTIHSSLRQFHLQQWNKASLGLKPRNQQMDIKDGVSLLYNVTKHVYVLNATIKYVKHHQPQSLPTDILNLSESAIHQLNLINGELDVISNFAACLKQKEKLEPVDLIKPKQLSYNYLFPLLTTSAIFISVILLKTKSIISFFMPFRAVR